MAIADGYYRIVSADNTSAALDVRGGSDYSGATVQYYERNDSDAQLVSVRNKDQDGVSGITVMFPLCGKCLDVVDGGTVPLRNGTPVQTYDGNGSRAQMFLPVATGEKATVGAYELDVYKLRSLALNDGSAQYCLDGSGASAESGTVCWIWQEYDGGAQRWVFVPVPQPMLGVYRIHPASNVSLALDVAGGSAQDGANLQVYTCNDSNSQRFVLSEGLMGDDLLALANVESGKWVDVAGGHLGAWDGQNVQMMSGNGSDAQQWALIPRGQVEVNGVNVDAFEMAPKVGSGFRLDAAGGGDTPCDNVQIWTGNGGVWQAWALVPDEAEATDVAAPGSVRMVVDGDVVGSTVAVGGRIVAYPSWTGSGDKFKVRWRHRLKPPGRPWSSWSQWSNLRDGSGANGGWGDAWAYSVKGDGASRTVAPYGIPVDVDGSSVDEADVEVEVRRFLDSWGPMGRETCAHTASSCETFHFKRERSLSLGDVVGMGPDGIVVPYSTDSPDGGLTLVVDGSCFSPVEVSGAPSSGTVLVPFDALASLPADGDAVRVSVGASYPNGTSSSASSVASVSYDAGSGMDLSVTAVLDATRMGYVVSCAGADAAYVAVPTETGGARFAACPRLSDGSWLVLPPFGGPCEVFVSGRDGERWAVSHTTIDAVRAPFHVWVFGPDMDTVVALSSGQGSPPSVSHVLAPDSERCLTVGRDLPRVGFGRTVVSECSVSASVHGGDLEETVRAIRSLAASGRRGETVVYRDPFGFWAEVAVTSVSMPRSNAGFSSVEVTQEAVS